MPTNFIYKLTFDPTSYRSTLAVPKGSKILTAQAQQEFVSVWYENSGDSQYDHRSIFFCVTGSLPPSSEPVTYLATCQFNNGNFIVHVYLGEAH